MRVKLKDDDHEFKVGDLFTSLESGVRVIFHNVNNNTTLTMIDNLDLISEYGEDPSYFHPCLNFTNIKINFIKHLPTPKELLNLIL